MTRPRPLPPRRSLHGAHLPAEASRSAAGLSSMRWLHDPQTRLLVSFSGGRTSGKMAAYIREHAHPDADIRFVIANTGEEDERTLVFADRCDRAFDLDLVWVEAVVPPERGVGTRHRIVSFATAARDGEPYEQAIAKHGVPNRNFPHCTRELKERPITHWARSIGWKAGDYLTAIGIRADEIDRMSPTAEARGLVYPLVHLGIRKPDVLAWWSRQAFDLDLPEHRGNCVWCWKKSRRKLLTLAAEAPEVFDFPARMERLYPDAGPGERDRPRRFFRGPTSAAGIVSEAARGAFAPFTDPHFDAPDGCTESCDAFAGDLFEWAATP